LGDVGVDVRIVFKWERLRNAGGEEKNSKSPPGIEL
jgi:hypothetical protein